MDRRSYYVACCHQDSLNAMAECSWLLDETNQQTSKLANQQISIISRNFVHVLAKCENSDSRKFNASRDHLHPVTSLRLGPFTDDFT